MDENGKMVGVVEIAKALSMAKAAELDLVEVSPNATPPVCKILDYGKYKYQEQKRINEAKKKQKIIEVKEIKIRPNIDKHDYDVKLRNMIKFLKLGNKVKVTMRFRGREFAHKELGSNLLKTVENDLKEVGKVEQAPAMEEYQMIMIVAPQQNT